MFASRKQTRLPNYDYSGDNYYFITICTHEKACIFGTTERLSIFGEIAKQDIERLAEHYEGVIVDHFIVMPNHVHAIIVLHNSKISLNQIVGQYKSGVSRKIKTMDSGIQVWQRSFHDHIIRNQTAYEKIWSYIEYNAEKWEEDCFFPGRM